MEGNRICPKPFRLPRSAAAAHPDRTAHCRDVHDRAGLGHLDRACCRHSAGGITSGGHQLAPALRVDQARRLRRTDRRLGTPPVEQGVDGPLKARVHVVHVVHGPSVAVPGNPRERTTAGRVARRAPG